MLIDTEKIRTAIFEGQAKDAAERTGLSVRTIEGYRTDPTKSGYRDWEGISLKTALEIMKKMEEREMKRLDEIREYLENYGTNRSTEMDRLFGLFKSDVANMATKYRKGELYVDDAETAIEDLQPRLEENEELNERLALIKANPDKVFITDSDDNFMMI